MPKRHVLLPVSLATLALAGPAGATQPGANGAIAFSAAGARGSGAPKPAKLVTIGPTGGPTTTLPKAAGDIFDVTYSPDGTKLAYTTFKSGGKRPNALWISDASGLNARLVVRSPDMLGITWSPDGRTIVYGSYYAGLSAVDASGTLAPTTLLPAKRNISTLYPAFSPDGTKLLYTRTKMNRRSEDLSSSIWVTSSVGTEAHRVIGGTGDLTFCNAPDVSPDGTRITFDAFNGRRGKRARSAVVVANLDGTGLRTLAVSPKTDQYFDGPVWSPDATKLAVSLYGRPKAGSELDILDAASGARSAIFTLKPGSTAYPAWQPLPVAPPVL